VSDLTAPLAPRPRPWRGFANWRNNLISNPKFQSWAATVPGVRRFVARDGKKLFDLVGGFVTTQVLLACVELEVFAKVKNGPLSCTELARQCDLPPGRMELLCRAAVGAELLQVRRDGCFELSRLSAAMTGVPGLMDMIEHHRLLYRDLNDPVRLLRGEVQTELAEFWPYVFGQSGIAPETAEKYSKLMADSLVLVAQETLQTVSLSRATCLMDVGGGTGGFLEAVSAQYPELDLKLFDLPEVVAKPKFHSLKLEVHGGSFREDVLPVGADAISLVRVMYDHSDETVNRLLAKIFAALPPGGRVILSEPMADDASPNRAIDGYFAFYTLAMRTGQVRTRQKVAQMLENVGFGGIELHKPQRAFITSVVTAVKFGEQ